MGAGFLIQIENDGKMQVTTHVYLGMSGAIHLFPPLCLHGVDGDNFVFITLSLS